MLLVRHSPGGQPMAPGAAGRATTLPACPWAPWALLTLGTWAGAGWLAFSPALLSSIMAFRSPASPLHGWLCRLPLSGRTEWQLRGLAVGFRWGCGRSVLLVMFPPMLLTWGCQSPPVADSPCRWWASDAQRKSLELRSAPDQPSILETHLAYTLCSSGVHFGEGAVSVERGREQEEPVT